LKNSKASRKAAGRTPVSTWTVPRSTKSKNLESRRVLMQTDSTWWKCGKRESEWRGRGLETLVLSLTFYRKNPWRP